MRKHRIRWAAAASLLILVSFTDGGRSVCDHGSWGFYGHKKINEMAVNTLPEPMFGFYKTNIEFLIEHSVDPDKRRYGIKGEAECHYIDMDHYCPENQPDCDPFANVPLRWDDAIARFTEDTLRAHGIVPWHVNLMVIRLTEAFRNEDVTRILRISAELGHYVGDAHVPLHTTSNYNGQKTGQRGIHGFWESRIPELYEPGYDFFVGEAQYIKSPLQFIWERVRESYAAVDTVLSFEQNLNAEFPSDQKYSFESRGQAQIKTYSRDYSYTYNQMLDGQVERRMRRAVLSIGSLWYTAWVNAGQPDLEKFTDIKPSDEDIEIIRLENEAVNDPGLKVREHDN